MECLQPEPLVVVRVDCWSRDGGDPMDLVGGASQVLGEHDGLVVESRSAPGHIPASWEVLRLPCRAFGPKGLIDDVDPTEVGMVYKANTAGTLDR